MKPIKIATGAILFASATRGLYWCLIGYRDSDQSVLEYLKYGALVQPLIACWVFGIVMIVKATNHEDA